ncbi:DUF6882 domain-containing protein [Saccharothrix violaceirubra]|uniref:Uncharacterized protein n=1 Tax=Saccharothrix violaceirubra TaxID=413306 RepID=A0A7W7T766_9PSEU|nr:DUF6882 domain-containing protein [Saccharothrix violaceirubra]MBB4966495.1 hypothetical protein [Saccharothrix violaceirubra]
MSPTLSQLLDDAALLSFEHQLRLSEVLGRHSWGADLQAGRFEFTGDHPLVCTASHLLGTAAPGPGSWLWSWANPAGYGPAVTGLAASVRDFGARHGIAQLAEAEVPFSALPGVTDAVGAAGVLVEAAKAVSGRFTSYTADAGGGTRIAVLIEHPDLALPAPEPARVMRVLQQGVAELPLTDHRRAVYAYGVRRGLRVEFGPDHRNLVVTGPGLSATVDFDPAGRVSGISASLGHA